MSVWLLSRAGNKNIISHDMIHPWDALGAFVYVFEEMCLIINFGVFVKLV